MSRSDTLPIFLETYKLVMVLYQVVINFPREHKFSLGQDIQKDAMNLFRCIYRANHHQIKAPYLEDYLAGYEMLKLEIRLAAELKIISKRKYVQLALMMETIGKQATAWHKHEKARRIKPAGNVQPESDLITHDSILTTEG